MDDILNQLTAVHREVGVRQMPAGEGRTVVLRRTFPSSVEDVWDAVTDPERLRRWFLPVTGEFRVGGKYQLEGNAGGEILRCEPPGLLRVTWIYGEVTSDADISEVEVRLSADPDGGTVFVLEHAQLVSDHWTEFGPGAAGVGWDLGLLGLELHLRGGHIEDPAAWESSPQAREFAIRSSQAWGAADEASGTAPAEAARAARNTSNFYAPELEPDPGTADPDPNGS